MVEPTESEDKHELDRFCDAMIAIRDEIEAIHKGDVALAESMLRHAPHTAHAIASGDWVHEYERWCGLPGWCRGGGQVLASGMRIDGAYGDRHLVCSCPPPEAFESEGREPATPALNPSLGSGCFCVVVSGSWEPKSNRPGTPESSGSDIASRCAATWSCSSGCSATASSSSSGP